MVWDNFDKKITFGFQIMSGYHLKGVTRKDLENLGGLKIDWGSEILEKEINVMYEQILSVDFFKFLSSWKTFSIRNLTSDYIALNYLLVLLKDWEKKGKPTGKNKENQIFRKNAIILFDRVIYEYIMKIWRSASDSRIASNLIEIEESNDIFNPIPNKDWDDLIKEMVDEGTISGEKYTSQESYDIRIKPLLYYYYALRKIPGPDDPRVKGVDVDHIIPYDIFEECPNNSMKLLRNNIINLAFLPHQTNIRKSSKKLSQLKDHWLIQQIVKYEEIVKGDFTKYSEANNIEDLREFRGELIKSTFIDVRKDLIEN